MTDSLPVACCPSEQRLFLIHSLFLCTLQIHTIVLWQGRQWRKGDNEEDGKGDDGDGKEKGDDEDGKGNNKGEGDNKDGKGKFGMGKSGFGKGGAPTIW